MIQFTCPHCGKAYQVEDSMAGKKAKCKACQNIITVPAPAAESPLPISALGNVPSSPPPISPTAMAGAPGGAGIMGGYGYEEEKPRPPGTINIIAFVLCFLPFLGVVGLILGIIGVGKKCQLAGLGIAAIVLGALSTIGLIIWLVAVFAFVGGLSGLHVEANRQQAMQEIRSLNGYYQMAVAMSKASGENIDFSTAADYSSACAILIKAGLIDMAPVDPPGWTYTTRGTGESLKFEAKPDVDVESSSFFGASAREEEAHAMTRSLNSVWGMYVAKSKVSDDMTVRGKSYSGAIQELLDAGLLDEAPTPPRGYRFGISGAGDILRFTYSKK